MSTGNRYPDLFSRLVAHVEIDPYTDCWTWTGPTRRHGGGHRPAISMRTPGAGREGHPLQRNAARLMCRAVHGLEPTPAHEASHLCPDNWLCVCPDHLIWETKAENMARQWARWRDERALDLDAPCERPGTIEAPF